VQNSEVYVAKAVRSERAMGMVACIVQILSDSDNEFKATVFYADTDKVLVGCGSSIFGLADKRETEAWPGC
jgi:hypothetical protein